MLCLVAYSVEMKQQNLDVEVCRILLLDSIVLYFRQDGIPCVVEIAIESPTEGDDPLQCGVQLFALVHQCGLSAHYSLKNAAPASGKGVVLHRPNREPLAVPLKVNQVVLNDAQLFVFFVFLQTPNLLLCHVADISTGCLDHLLSLTSEPLIAVSDVLSLFGKDSMRGVSLPGGNTNCNEDCANGAEGLNPARGIYALSPCSYCLPTWVYGECKAKEKKYKRECANRNRDSALRTAVVVGSHKPRLKLKQKGYGCHQGGKYEPR